MPGLLLRCNNRERLTFPLPFLAMLLLPQSSTPNAPPASRYLLLPLMRGDTAVQLSLTTSLTFSQCQSKLSLCLSFLRTRLRGGLYTQTVPALQPGTRMQAGASLSGNRLPNLISQILNCSDLFAWTREIRDGWALLSPPTTRASSLPWLKLCCGWNRKPLARQTFRPSSGLTPPMRTTC